MYDKITINSGNMEDLCEHLDMNGYCFERIGMNLYVFNEETDYVKTILHDYGYDYWVNDGLEM